MVDDVYVNMSIKDFLEFQVEYNKAVKNKEQVFMFKEKEFLTGYAKYLIEYLKSKTKDNG